MRKQLAQFSIDLTEAAPDLLSLLGEQEYSRRVANLEAELRRGIRLLQSDAIAAEIKTTSLRPASTRSAILAIGTISVALAAATGSTVDVEKFSKFLRTIWSALKRILPVSTRVIITVNGKNIDITARDEEAAQALLRESVSAATTLDDSALGAPATKVTIAFTPNRR